LSFKKRIVFAAALPVLALVAAEIVCRFLPGGQATSTRGYIERWDHWQQDHHAQIERVADDLWVLRNPTSNADGMRDIPHEIGPEPGVRRIACLGDSVTIGFGVSPLESYPWALQQLLRRRNIPVEVFNVSMMGWTVRQYRAAYRDIIRKYGVDDVILGICLNDVPEMQNNLAASRLSSLVTFLHQRSALIRVLVGAHAREIGTVEELFHIPDAPHVANAWKLFDAELLALRDEITSDGVRLVLVLFPFRFQLLDDAPDPVPQTRLGQFCREHGIPFLDLLEPLENTGPEAFHDYDHLSAVGGKAVADAILHSGLLDPAQSSK
jgi:lysophospholipase L1-like esterase